jgi:hypothetical protein
MLASGPRQPRRGSGTGKRSRPTDDLDALLDAILSAMDALLGIYNQPRMGLHDGGGEKGAAVVLLSDEMDRLSNMCGEIHAEAARRSPTDEREAESRRKFASPGGSAAAWAGARSRRW